MTLLAAKTAELIAGYTIRERIGAGGYGEVWKADAPGGLTKAIKFVYGCLDDERAASELKALNRIKEVRHPFLLSLERIEIADGQLIIITELADGSLKDRFEQCKQADLPGIPREELLVCLHDAADALDYMRTSFSLQHLDIKPENLLIVGGRVKVADFGLVKDIHEATMSLMAGLTPVYASPEVFDGRPSLHSDQYSLAIVYQEMLTRVLPFPGRTPSQLASQHLHSSPRLGALPLADRAIVNRALSKDPQHRFASCRELIEALREAGAVAARSSSPTPTSTPPEVSLRAEATEKTIPEPSRAAKPQGCAPPVERTVSFGEVAPSCDVPGASAAAVPPSAESMTLAEAPAIEALPAIEIVPGEVPLGPVLVLGIGGTGARVLRKLHTRLHERFDDLGAVPVIQLLLMDTDLQTISQAVQGDEATALHSQSTISMPLRKPEDYRDRSDLGLGWLSRRWLYNIPRSLRTEGLRPLGRLAFVDHSRTVCARIQDAIAAITSADARSASAQQTSMSVSQEGPRVYVVASISGGTGGGMVIDTAYAVRAILEGLGIAQSSLCGILTHSTPRNPRERDLAAANAYAFLTELQHFRRAGHCSGDENRHLPSSTTRAETFDHTYLVHLGDDLSEEQFDAAAEAVAEYLYLDAATSGAQFFRKCREGAGDAATRDAGLPLRSFGLHQIGWSQNQMLKQATERLCETVVRRWCGDTERLGTSRAAPSPEVPLQQTELADRILALLGPQSDGDVAASLDHLLQSWFVEKTSKADGLVLELEPAEILEAVNRIVGAPCSADELRDKPSGTVQKSLVSGVSHLAETEAIHLTDAILALLDHSDAGAQGSRRAAQSFLQRLRTMESDALAQQQQILAQLSRFERELLAAKPSESRRKTWLAFGGGRKRVSTLDPRWKEYMRSRLDLLVTQASCLLLKGVHTRIATLSERVGDLQHELTLLAQVFGKAADEMEAADTSGTGRHPLSDLRRNVATSFPGHSPEWVAEIDRRWREAFLSSCGGLRGVLEKRIDLRGTLVDRLRRAARKALCDALRQTGSTQFLLPLTDAPEETTGLLKMLLDKARPTLNSCGGAQRMLFVCPAGAKVTTLREAMTRELLETPSVVFDSDGDIVLCCELERIPLRLAAARLIEGRPDYAQIASRLHARTDVTWSPL